MMSHIGYHKLTTDVIFGIVQKLFYITSSNLIWIKLTFLMLFDHPLLKYFFVCNGCFGLFTKIKRGSGTSFWCTFCP